MKSIKTFEEAGILIEYVSDETFLNEKELADNVYLRHKENNKLRNQSFFRNNLRKKGIPVECALCKEDNIVILDKLFNTLMI